MPRLPVLLSLFANANELIQAIRSSQGAEQFQKAITDWNLKREEWIYSYAEYSGVDLPANRRGGNCGKEFRLALSELKGLLQQTQSVRLRGLDSRVEELWFNIRTWGPGTANTPELFIVNHSAASSLKLARALVGTAKLIEELMAYHQICSSTPSALPFLPSQQAPTWPCHSKEERSSADVVVRTAFAELDQSLPKSPAVIRSKTRAANPSPKVLNLRHLQTKIFELHIVGASHETTAAKAKGDGTIAALAKECEKKLTASFVKSCLTRILAIRKAEQRPKS